MSNFYHFDINQHLEDSVGRTSYDVNHQGQELNPGSLEFETRALAIQSHMVQIHCYLQTP